MPKTAVLSGVSMSGEFQGCFWTTAKIVLELNNLTERTESCLKIRDAFFNLHKQGGSMSMNEMTAGLRPGKGSFSRIPLMNRGLRQLPL
jgi:hypothetical protein